MKLSELTVEYLANYLRIDDISDVETDELTNIMSSVKSYIISYTGLTSDEIDTHEDITHAAIVLAGDMFESRNYMLDYKSTVENKAVVTILNMHSVNLL